MARILIFSSFVAGSNVGGTLGLKALTALGHEVSLVPTTLLGRHPGWGAPGGGAVPNALFDGMIEGLEANGIVSRADVILTGYFADHRQVERVDELLEQYRYLPDQMICVDPILGDDGPGLYVKPEVAEAIAEKLVPRANMLTPNAFELKWLRQRDATIKPYALVCETSVERGRDLGIRAQSGDELFEAYATRVQGRVPNGFGDLTTCLLLDAYLRGGLNQDGLNSVVSRLLGWISEQASDTLSELDFPALKL